MKLSSLFLENEYTSFTPAHYLPIILIILFGLLISLYARMYQNERQQRITGLFLGLIPFLGIFLKLFFNTYEGFNYHKDLPFHVCNFLAILAPVIMWKKNRFWLSVAYFWIIAGTLNANITPDIEFGYPHWGYFCYWLMHTGLLIIPIYSILVYRIHITLKDLGVAFFLANLYLIFSLAVNFSIDSNYMYTKQKPPMASLVDLMGPWPWYLVTAQFVALLLFLIAYIPFFFKGTRS